MNLEALQARRQEIMNYLNQATQSVHQLGGHIAELDYQISEEQKTQDEVIAPEHPHLDDLPVE